MRIELDLTGEPQPKQSFRTGIIKKKDGTSFMAKYQSKKVKDREKDFREQITAQLPKDFKPFEKGVYVVCIDYVFSPLKSFTKAQKAVLHDPNKILFKVTKPDLTDNLPKGLMDAMNGLVFKDDALICQTGLIRKFYGERPHTWIVLEEIE